MKRFINLSLYIFILCLIVYYFKRFIIDPFPSGHEIIIVIFIGLGISVLAAALFSVILIILVKIKSILDNFKSN